MRILFLTNMYPPHDIGGYEQLCREVAEGLRRRGHSVLVVTSRHGVTAPARAERDTIRSLYMQADLDYYRPLDFFLKRAGQEKFNQNELHSVVDQFQPEAAVVWGMYLFSLNLPYWLEQWLPGRVVYYIGSYWPIDDDPHRAYWRLLARRKFAEQVKRPFRALALSQLRKEKYPPMLQFAKTLCCSQFVKDKLVAAGAIADTAEVLYTGVDPAPFEYTKQARRPKNAPLRMLYFGRLIEDKGVHTAIEALGILNKRGVGANVEFTVLGGGHPEYEARLHALVATYKLEGIVRFVGKISRDEIPTWLSRFDVFLFTSIWPEPFGRTIVEAMLAGLVVIGSDVGGSHEIFSDYAADLLYPAGDAQALASRIALLLDGSKDTAQLIRRGRRLAMERFTLDTMTTGMENYLRAMAASDEDGPKTPAFA
ncbi:MAG: glycosyltransferase family 4 protein [Anaerolineales bacterium]|nr:glycosyltransferase family 4 protein [Anaerolineales bacterium]